MAKDFFSSHESRAERRRQDKERRRRARVRGLVMLVLAVIAVAVAVFLLSRERTAGAGGASPTPSATLTAAAAGSTPAGLPSPSGSSVLAAGGSASPAPGSSASPSPSPAKPPLAKPTKKHPLRVYFGGDSLAGLPGELLAIDGAKSGLMKVQTDYQVSSRLTNPDPVDWPQHLQAQMRSDRPDVGVFMIGINDPGMPMIAGGQYTSYPKKAWLKEYEHRAERLMLMMLHDGAKRVYWVGLPVMPEKGQTAQAYHLNELFKDAAAKHPSVVYVDTSALLATKKGGFIASLRSGDGVHFTNEGAQRIADAVWRAMKRDWQSQTGLD